MIFRIQALVLAGVALLSTSALHAQSPAPATAQSSDADAYYQFALGRHYESDGDAAAAVAAYKRAMALDPTAAEVPAEMAGLYARQGQMKEAIAAAQSALAIDPANVDAHRVLGSIYASTAEQQQAAGDAGASPSTAMRQAIEHLEKAHRADGTDRDAGLDTVLARLYMTAGQSQKAADLLRRVTEYEPDDDEAYLLLARAESALGHTDKAVAALEVASTANPRLLPTLAGLYESLQRWPEAARTYERLAQAGTPNNELKVKWAAALLQIKDDASANRARDLLVEVTRAAPTETRPLFLLSSAERQRHDYVAAEKAARQLMALDSTGATGPLALAQVYEDQRLFDKAADVLAPAVAKLDTADGSADHDTFTLIAHLGFAQLQAGRGADAVKTFERARALSKGQHGFETSLIQAYMSAKMYDKAAELARSARLAQPDEPRYAELEARALSLSGRKDRAVILLRDAATAHPEDVGTQLSFVQMLEDAGRASEADQALATTAERFPKDVRVSFERGALLEKRKDYTQAETAFRAALLQDPDHAPSLNYLGYMLAEHGDRLDEAVSLVGRALELDPDNGAYLDSLGWAYVQQKKYDRAEPLLRRAAEQMPANSVVQDHFGDLLWAVGRHPEAVTQWHRALDGDREELDVKAVEKKIARAR